MKYFQKLAKSGRSIVVSLHPALLEFCELMPGTFVIVEPLEDKTIRIRPATETDLRPRLPGPRIGARALPEQP